MLYKIVIQCSDCSENVESDYYEVLTNFYRSIETYDPTRPLIPWLQVCTKRYVNTLNERRNRRKLHYPRCKNALELENVGDMGFDELSSKKMGLSNYRECYNDDVLSLIDELPLIYRNALLMKEAGYSSKEIANIEHARGNLASRSAETIRVRISLARQYLRKHLNRDGERISDNEFQEDIQRDCGQADQAELQIPEWWSIRQNSLESDH